jgi:3-polyprenyl-4-hydroxybenzoate decarboxylase
MGVITTGLISSSIISNSSADSNITALELYQDLSDAGVITDVVFMNSSFTAFRDVATINRQVADAEAKVNFMNCSFYTTSDLYSCIKSGAPVDVSYANCTFKTEQNFTGTPLVNINQAVTNTADNQGNTYI